MPDAFEQFAEVAKAINDGALQKQMDAYRKAAKQHRDDAAAAEAAAVKAMETINENKKLEAAIDRKTAALASGKTKLAQDKDELANRAREFDEYRDAENASLNARGDQLTVDEDAAATVLATKEQTERANAKMLAMKAQYEARLAELGLQKVA